MSLEKESDKFFWHHYVEFYEKFFQNRDFLNIAEIGIFKGNSIKWLMNRFPNSKIIAADILPVQSEWPVSDRVTYFNIDQTYRDQIGSFFSTGIFDLIIEDGSHLPHHQVNSLLEGFPRLSSKGLYILEDIHTSLNHNKGNALTVLLAIDHFNRLGVDINEKLATEIAYNSFMNYQDVLYLSSNIKNISIYKRTQLPDRCYNCNSTVFNYSGLRCVCGVDLFAFADSMTCVIEKI